MIATTAAPAAETDYTNEAQQRLMHTVQSLAGHEMHGLAPADLVKLTGHTSSQITRDLANLKSREWAEQIPQTGRWRLAPAIVRIGMKFAIAADQAQQRLNEMRNRYSA